jgi:hypothetical protein
MKRCDICITEDCGGTKSCHCDTCTNLQKCNKVLRPVIRITSKCTQQCRHCCFDCSPIRTEQMTLDTAKLINQFLTMYEIKAVSIMGGEFFCNPNWLPIFDTLLPSLEYCRLVTNGDWAEDPEFLKQLLPYKDRLSIAISEDPWHTNKFTRRAVEQCEDLDFYWVLPSDSMKSNNVIVPVGRSEGSMDSVFGFFSTYCSNPQHQYSFLIDEIGGIFKCSFGRIKYANIVQHLDGSFPSRFKEVNQKFYNSSPMSCFRCASVYLR